MIGGRGRGADWTSSRRERLPQATGPPPPGCSLGARLSLPRDRSAAAWPDELIHGVRVVAIGDALLALHRQSRYEIVAASGTSLPQTGQRIGRSRTRSAKASGDRPTHRALTGLTGTEGGFDFRLAIRHNRVMRKGKRPVTGDLSRQEADRRLSRSYAVCPTWCGRSRSCSSSLALTASAPSCFCATTTVDGRDMGDFHLVHAGTVAVCRKGDRASRGDLLIPLPAHLQPGPSRRSRSTSARSSANRSQHSRCRPRTLRAW